MDTVRIEDLPRDDALTAEEMQRIEAGWAMFPPIGPSGSTGSAVTNVLKSIGEGLQSVARS